MLNLCYLCFLVFLVCASSFPTGNVTFEENFETPLDTTKWIYQTGHKSFGTNRLMCYKEENVAVTNGLTITAKVEYTDCDDGAYNFTSGRIKTQQQFNFKSIEVRAKMTNGDGLQPGIWTQHSTKQTYEEMDLVEIKGTEITKLHSALHWGTKQELHTKKLKKCSKSDKKSDLSKEFHTYGLERTEDYLIYYFDGVPYFTVSRTNPNCPQGVSQGTAKLFSEPCHLLFSLAVGGNWFSNQVTPEEAKKWTKPTLNIACVKVYE